VLRPEILREGKDMQTSSAKLRWGALAATGLLAAAVAVPALVLGMSKPPSGDPVAGAAADPSNTGVYAAADFRARLPQDEVIYFLLPDRFENGDAANDTGGIVGDRLAHGFDPTAKGFFHGGDLKGLTARLDYIQGMGATAIWLAPIFKNKPVQGDKGQESAGYHGYWVTDFTTVDPHFGTEAEFKAFVDAAHKRGMKVYMDIITNHSADVISFAECAGKPCPYRSRAEYPYSVKSADGSAINPGFAGDSMQTAENFILLKDPNYAYTVTVPEAEKNIKVPAWMNDPIYYHNRGNTTFTGESSTMGDFVGLDDFMTENPKVIDGFIEVYGSWIDRFGIDGFRIDTAKHVNPEFWTKFASAMMERAKAKGIPNFHIFGEVASGEMDPALLAASTHRAKLPTVLDFAFRRAVQDAVAGNAGSDIFERLFAADILYNGGEATALQLPTFLGNHDFGRFAHFVRKEHPTANDTEVLARTKLGHAMLMLLRGVPTIYSGDEQGFAGDGIDQDAREDMFASKTAVYNDNKLVGSAKTTAEANFDVAHPLYMEIAALAKARAAHPALRRGKQIVRAYSEKPGLFAVSRFDPDTNREFLIVFNTSNAAIDTAVEVSTTSEAFTTILGACASAASAPGQIKLSIPAFGYAVCAANEKKRPD
jgi:glycosidase